MSLLERCPHFRGCYVQASVELGPEDVSLLERCPHFRGRVHVLLERRPDLKRMTLSNAHLRLFSVRTFKCVLLKTFLRRSKKFVTNFVLSSASSTTIQCKFGTCIRV